MKQEAARLSETSVPYQSTTQRHEQEGVDLKMNDSFNMRQSKLSWIQNKPIWKRAHITLST